MFWMSSTVIQSQRSPATASWWISSYPFHNGWLPKDFGRPLFFNTHKGCRFDSRFNHENGNCKCYCHLFRCNAIPIRSFDEDLYIWEFGVDLNQIWAVDLALSRSTNSWWAGNVIPCCPRVNTAVRLSLNNAGTSSHSSGKALLWNDAAITGCSKSNI